MLTGCPGPQTQVRPEPPSLECPTGSYETHSHFELGRETVATLPGYKGEAGEDYATMKEGPFAMVVLWGWNKMPPGTLLIGTLTFGNDRFYGRFTQAQTPDRQTYPVCIQIFTPVPAAMRKGPDCPVGVGSCYLPGGKPGAFEFYPTQDIMRAKRFK